MACYYLVISSTHLSNGHLRSIKGVFRGPLCASGGAESPDYAEKEKAITKTLENLKANFYCELCDKQYHKHQEFDNHINSYDHAHKQRLKELKQREFARNVSSKSWKDERKQEKALKRLHQIALLKQQKDGDKEKKTKAKVAAQDQQQEKIRSNGSAKPGSKNILFQDQNHSSPSPDLSTKISQSEPVLTNQCSLRVKCSSLLAQTPKVHRHSKAGISFCFSKRAHLKLDSFASVFTDGLDETSDHQKVQRQQQKLALQALLSRSPSPTQDDHHVPLESIPLNSSKQRDLQTDQPNQEGSLEMQVMYCTIEPQRQSCYDTHGPEVGRQPASLKDRVATRCQKSRQERAYEGSSCQKNPSPTNTDGHNSAPGQLNAQYSKQELQGSSKQNNSVTENSLAEGDLSSKTFLNVLGKDGTKLKWPCELVQYTSDEPRVSYSCNPLFLNFKCTEGQEKSTGTEKADVCTISNQPNRVEELTPNVTKINLGILKPKKHKHRQRGTVRMCKIDAVRRHRVDCALSNFSQSPAEGQFEFSTPASKLHIKQGYTEKRHKLRNRKRSQDETHHQNLKSIIVNAFSAPQRRRRKRQRLPSALRLAKRRTLLHASIQSPVGSGDNYQWYGNSCKSKRDATVTPLKSSSWGVLSELRSDGEWPACQWDRHCTSSISDSSYLRRKGYSQPCSYIRKSSYSFPYYGYRHMSDSPNKDTGPREEYCDYKDSELYKERNYYGVCDTRCTIKQRYGIRKHKRHLRENRYRECHNPATKRICFYRVYEDGDPHDTARGWWCKRPSPDLRRHKRRNRFWLRSVVNHDRGHEQSSSMFRHSPASSSITSISDISGDCSSYIKQSYSGQSDFKWPAERSARTMNSREHTPREKSPSPTSTSIDRSQTVQLDTQPVISDFREKLEPVAQNSKSSHLTKHSTSTNKKVTNSRICTLSLPLIGKLPSIKKGIKQAGIHKEKGSSSNQVKTILNDQSKPESQAVFKTAHIDTQLSTLSQACPSLSDQRTAKPCASSETQTDRSMSLENVIRVLGKTSDKTPDDPQQSCSIPPLTEQPITFTEEEMDKYRLLQLQAQQHMQQKHLQEQHDMPRSSFVPQMNQLPVTGPEPSNQTVPAPCLSYTMHQHGPLSAFSSFISCPSACLASRSSPSAHPSLRPTLPQPHFTPLPFPTVFYQASPAVMLATHPLHLISAAPLHHAHPHSHIAGLTLHPPPHASLLPSVLTPAAMVAGRSLQIHHTPQPLFPHQDLQHHPGIAS